jgi:protein-L-isoaspartate(D-aspartate) O-methyltransferase
MTDFATRRSVMVDTQVRPNDVTRFPIIEAFLQVPRELFVPQSAREAAYVGEDIRLGAGRVLLEPRTIAKMLEAADIGPGDVVLDVATGTGYVAALAGRLGEAVIALEENAELATEAEAALAEAGADNVVVIEGEHAEGAAKHGPYDVILIEGAVEEVPEKLTSQLREGGRIVAIFAEGALGTVRSGLYVDGRVSWRFAFNAGAPILRGFEAAKSFAL